MIRKDIRKELDNIYSKMTSDELGEIGVFIVTAGSDPIYCHSGFNVVSNTHNFTDEIAVEVMKLSIASQLRAREKGMNYQWTAEDIAGYAYEMAKAMKDKNNYE